MEGSVINVASSSREIHEGGLSSAESPIAEMSKRGRQEERDFRVGPSSPTGIEGLAKARRNADAA